jgi:hypothetical protein
MFLQASKQASILQDERYEVDDDINNHMQSSGELVLFCHFVHYARHWVSYS